VKWHCSTRSIYFDEFDNFVERMAAVSSDKIEDYKFDLNVMKPLLDVLLDTSLGAEVKRKRYVCHKLPTDGHASSRQQHEKPHLKSAKPMSMSMPERRNDQPMHPKNLFGRRTAPLRVSRC